MASAITRPSAAPSSCNDGMRARRSARPLFVAAIASADASRADRAGIMMSRGATRRGPFANDVTRGARSSYAGERENEHRRHPLGARSTRPARCRSGPLVCDLADPDHVRPLDHRSRSHAACAHLGRGRARDHAGRRDYSRRSTRRDSFCETREVSEERQVDEARSLRRWRRRRSRRWRSDRDQRPRSHAPRASPLGPSLAWTHMPCRRLPMLRSLFQTPQAIPLRARTSRRADRRSPCPRRRRP